MRPRRPMPSCSSQATGRPSSQRCAGSSMTRAAATAMGKLLKAGGAVALHMGPPRRRDPRSASGTGHRKIGPGCVKRVQQLAIGRALWLTTACVRTGEGEQFGCTTSPIGDACLDDADHPLPPSGPDHQSPVAAPAARAHRRSRPARPARRDRVAALPGSPGVARLRASLPVPRRPTGTTRPADWNNPALPKLWLYNLHYFDDLLAADADRRAAWHARLIERWVAESPPLAGNRGALSLVKAHRELDCRLACRVRTGAGCGGQPGATPVRWMASLNTTSSAITCSPTARR